VISGKWLSGTPDVSIELHAACQTCLVDFSRRTRE